MWQRIVTMLRSYGQHTKLPRPLVTEVEQDSSEREAVEREQEALAIRLNEIRVANMRRGIKKG